MYRKIEETDFSLTSYGRNGVLLIGRGVAYRKTEETDFSSTSYGPNEGPVHWEGCGSHKMGLHGLLFIDHLLPCSSLHGLLFIHRRPPPACTCDYSSTACPSCLHQLLFIHGLLFIQPPPVLHRLLVNQPPPRGTFSTPLHGLLFIQPSTGSCSSTPNRLNRSGSFSSSSNSLYYNGVLFIHPPPGTVHPTPPTTLNVHQEAAGSRLPLAAVAKESLDRVQLTAIDRSLGFCNA